MARISHFFCTFVATLKRKVSSSSRNRQVQVTQKTQMQPHIHHICGLLFCVWVQVFGDTFELMQTVAHFPYYKYSPSPGRKCSKKRQNMKKKYLSVIAAGLLLVTSTTFTSCNKDDEDVKSDLEWAEGGYKYVEPCLQWTAQVAEVSGWMDSNAKDFRCISKQDSFLAYDRLSPLTQIMYTFDIGGHGLSNVMVTYNSLDAFPDVKNRIEAKYNCKFKQNDDNNDYYEADNVLVSGKKTTIDIIVLKNVQMPTGGSVGINYSIDI